MRKLFRRGVLSSLAALPLAPPWTSSRAQVPEFPDPPLRLIVGFPPGSPSDLLAQLIAPGIGEQLGRAVLVDNLPGANGETAVAVTAKRTPDGATFMLASNRSTTIAPALGRAVPYDVRTDFSAVAPAGFTPLLLVARADLPAKNTAELLDLLRAHQAAAKGGSAGAGDPTHLALELFKAMAGLDIEHLPYKETGLALADLMAGKIDICFASLSTALPHVRAGKIQALGQTGFSRSAGAPTIPTIAEAGLPGYEAVTSYGIYLPAGTPAELADRLNAAVEATLRAPAAAKKLAALGIDPQFGSPAQFAAYIAHDQAKWSALAKATGLKVD